MGTKIQNVKVTKVTDGDTIKVKIDDKEETIRLICIYTEDSNGRGSSNKPITNAGKMASAFADSYFKNAAGNLIKIDLEFDTSDPIPVCLSKYRGNYSRLLFYVHKGAENYNLKLIELGYSPYFVKYGRSRLYHDQMTKAEFTAQKGGLIIWNPVTNDPTSTRDYTTLIPWWRSRDSAVVDYRQHPKRSRQLI